MGKTTQAERILAYMNEFGSITWIDAYMDLGVARLAARIAGLKKAGFLIVATPESAMNRYGEPCHFMRYRIKND